MIELERKYLNEVKLILRTFVPGCKVRAFGSRVSGEAQKFSDLDLAVEGEKTLEIATIAKLKEAFSESDLPIKIDILDWNSISDRMRKHIEYQYDVIQKGIDNA